MINKYISVKHTAMIIALVMLMMTALGSFSSSYATLYKPPEPVQTDSMISSNNFTDEYYKVTTPLNETGVIYVEGKTKKNGGHAWNIININGADKNFSVFNFRFLLIEFQLTPR